jgi:iron complex outermembrane receptor protein
MFVRGPSGLAIVCALASLAIVQPSFAQLRGIEGGIGVPPPIAPPIEEPAPIEEPSEEGHAHPHAHTHTHAHAEGQPHDHGELGVTAAIAPPREADPVLPAASELTIDPGIMNAVPRNSASDLLTFAPGVLLSNHAGEGHAPTIFMRGYDAGEGQDIEMLVDGIPFNEPSNAHGHGYADSRFLIPELVRSLRVLQGPFDPRQGDFAIAGTAEFHLGMQQRGVMVRGEYGMFDTRRIFLGWAPERMEEGTFVGVELQDSAGFAANRASFGAALLGRFEHRMSREVTLSVLGASQAADYSTAGVARRDLCEDDFFCVLDPNQGGSMSRHLVGLGLTFERPNERFTQRVWGGYRQLRIRENFTGQLLDDRGDGLDEQYEAGTVGLRGEYRVRIPWNERDQHVEIGYLGRHDSGATSAWRLDREHGTPYDTLFDSQIHVTDIGAWILGEFRPFDELSIRAGVRADAFHYVVVDRDLGSIDREGPRLPTDAQDAFGIAIAPRGTVRVGLAEWLDWITSAGVGTRSSDAVALSEGEQAPFARVIALESGLALALQEARVWSVEARASLFHAYVDRDLVFDPSRGRNVTVGSSNRYGAFAFVRVKLEEWLDAATSFAWTEANLPADYFDLTAGDRLPFVPRLTGRVDLAARKTIEVDGEPLTFAGALGVTWIGPRPLPNGAEGDAYAVADLSASFGWRFAELGVEIQNLFDVRYERSSFHHASRFDPERPESLALARHYAAGAPFTVMATLTLRLEPLRWLSGEGGEE